MIANTDPLLRWVGDNADAIVVHNEGLQPNKHQRLADWTDTSRPVDGIAFQPLQDSPGYFRCIVTSYSFNDIIALTQTVYNLRKGQNHCLKIYVDPNKSLGFAQFELFVDEGSQSQSLAEWRKPMQLWNPVRLNFTATAHLHALRIQIRSPNTNRGRVGIVSMMVVPT